jgi:alpha-D-xyloside xylohydrolase
MDVIKSVFDDTVEAQIRKDADGVHAYTPSVRQIVDRKAFHTKLEFEWMPGEALYGLGSHEEGMMNLREHQYLYQQNMRRCTSFFHQGYGIYWITIRHDIPR